MDHAAAVKLACGFSFQCGTLCMKYVINVYSVAVYSA